MPLKPGADKETISENISEMFHHGHPLKQSVAAALHNADKYRATVNDVKDTTTSTVPLAKPGK